MTTKDFDLSVCLHTKPNRLIFKFCSVRKVCIIVSSTSSIENNVWFVDMLLLQPAFNTIHV